MTDKYKDIVREVLRAKHTDHFGMLQVSMDYINEKQRLEWDMQVDSRFLTRLGDEKRACLDYVKEVLNNPSGSEVPTSQGMMILTQDEFGRPYLVKKK